MWWLAAAAAAVATVACMALEPTQAGRQAGRGDHVAATCAVSPSGRLTEGNSKTRSCSRLTGKHENIACSINSGGHEHLIAGRDAGASSLSRCTYLKVRC